MHMHVMTYYFEKPKDKRLTKHVEVIPYKNMFTLVAIVLATGSNQPNSCYHPISPLPFKSGFFGGYWLTGHPKS